MQTTSLDATINSINDTSINRTVWNSGHTHSSGVAWGAVAAGALTMTAFSLILLALGTGMGLSSVSPWSDVGASASTIGAAAIAWLIFTSLVASALGGYLTGRLRTRWLVVHTDEVHFRDTANGFLAGCVATLITVTLLTSAAASMVGGAANTAALSAAVHPSTAAPGGSYDYFVDSLLRSGPPVSGNPDSSLQPEAGRIFAHAMYGKMISPVDKSYLAGLVSARTGMNKADAESRVSAVMAEATQWEDTARKLTAHLLLWIFLMMMSGAFAASFAATIGGRQRDHVQSI